MTEFSVKVSETFVRVINVEALTEHEAIAKVMEKYKNGDVTTNKDVANVTSVTFAISKPPKFYISKAQP
jgi:hypothetical protein